MRRWNNSRSSTVAAAASRGALAIMLYVVDVIARARARDVARLVLINKSTFGRQSEAVVRPAREGRDVYRPAGTHAASAVWRC